VGLRMRWRGRRDLMGMVGLDELMGSLLPLLQWSLTILRNGVLILGLLEYIFTRINSSFVTIAIRLF
jgi:hypothetical protein